MASWKCGGIFNRQLNNFQLGSRTLCSSRPERRPTGKRRKKSMDSSFLITAWPKSATASNTWVEIHEVMAWNFTALFQGTHPEVDWKGRALPANLKRLARKPITPEGHSFWVFNFLGDLKYYANHLGLPHWQSKKFCWLCDCEKGNPLKNPFDFTSEPGYEIFARLERKP